MTITWLTPHPRGTCWVSDKKKAVFINIPKCASTTLKRQINGGRGVMSRGTSVIEDDEQFCESNFIERDDLGRYYIFTVVRNVVDRFLSAYQEAARSTNTQNFLPSVEEAVRLLPADHQENWRQEWFAPQVWHLDGINVDAMIHMDRMYEGMEKVGERLNISFLPAPSDGRNITSKPDRVTVTEEQAHLIKEFYADDIRMMNEARENGTML